KNKSKKKKIIVSDAPIFLFVTTQQGREGRGGVTTGRGRRRAAASASFDPFRLRRRRSTSATRP
ncbi:unnamed protein product, partial [Musa hybrid cultivar]